MNSNFLDSVLIAVLMVFSYSIYAATSNVPVTIRLDNCEGDMYCISLGGPAFNKILPVRFDTGAATLSIPESCLTPGKYTVLAKNVPSQFQQNSDIVKADVSLMNDETAGVTLKDFVFYAIKDVPCQNMNGSHGNFGAAMNYINYDAKNCVASYFNYYTAVNKPTSQFGFTIQNGRALLVGPIIEYDVAYFQQLPDPKLKCSGVLRNTPSYSRDNLDQSWLGPLVDGFHITINNIPVPVTSSNTIGPQPTTKLAQIDTGGGLMIIADDSTQNISTIFDSITQPCMGIEWLEGCSCVIANQAVVVSAKQYKVHYHYLTSDYNKDLKRAIAICPANGATPYVSPNSANLGYQLFSHGTVIFDYKNGRIGFADY